MDIWLTVTPARFILDFNDRLHYFEQVRLGMRQGTDSLQMEILRKVIGSELESLKVYTILLLWMFTNEVKELIEGRRAIGVS